MANLLVSSAYLGELRPAEGTDPLVTVAVAGPTSRGPRLSLRVDPATARLFRLTGVVVRLRVVVVLVIAAATFAAYYLTRDLAVAGAAYFVATLVFLIEIFGRLRGYPMILAGGKDVALLGLRGSAAWRWVEANPPGSIRFQPPDAPSALRVPPVLGDLVTGSTLRVFTLLPVLIIADIALWTL